MIEYNRNLTSNILETFNYFISSIYTSNDVIVDPQENAKIIFEKINKNHLIKMILDFITKTVDYMDRSYDYVLINLIFFHL